MNDLISRQAAINAAAEVIKELKQLPSTQEWIPCSERLPEQSGTYLVTVYCTKYIDFVDKFDYTPTSDGWVDPETAIDWNDYVVAWMPLPEPWKGE